MKNLFTAILMAAMFAFAGTAFAGPPPVTPADTAPTPDDPAVPAIAPPTVPSGEPEIADEAQDTPPNTVIDELFGL